jgi:hypothetical protein
MFSVVGFGGTYNDYTNSLRAFSAAGKGGEACYGVA